MLIHFKDNIPNIPIYKSLYDNVVLPYLNKHKYSIKDCYIGYDMIGVDEYHIVIKPIEDIIKIELEVTIE